MVNFADVLALVEPDRAALPTLCAAGTLLAMTVRRRGDTVPCRADGSQTRTGLPPEAALGQRVRVWRVRDGSWFDPFEGWTVSWGARWSPDGGLLAGLVQRGQTAPSVAVWDSATGEVHDLDVAAAPFFTFERAQWVPGGAALIVETRSAPPRRPADPETTGVAVRVLRSPDERVPSEDPLDSADLSLVELTGSSTVLVRGWTVRAWRVCPDGYRVGCLRLARIASEVHQAYFDLCVVDLRSGRVVTVARDIPQSYGLGWSWSPDGTQLAYVASGAHRVDEVWVVPADGTRAARRISDGGGLWSGRDIDDVRGDYQAPRWLDTETLIWHREGFGFVTIDSGTGDTTITATPGGAREQWLTEIDDPTPPLGPDGSFYSVRTTADGFAVDQIDPRQGQRVTVADHGGTASTSLLQVGGWVTGGAFVVRSAQQPGELWLVEAGAVRRLADLNPGRAEIYTAERVAWTDNGQQLGAGLLLPVGPTPQAGWPLLINVYGGGRSSSLIDTYDPTNGLIHASLLTSNGWAVMFPDLPITDQHPMAQFAPLLRSALQHLPMGLVDPTRIAIGGNSYGSYTTLSLLVTMPDTFKAAVISAPLVNPFASYAALRDDGAALDGLWEKGQGRLIHPPWVNPQTWVENTPFLFLDRVRAPLLIGVGTHGLPGELAQAEQLFGGLRRLGKTVEFRHYAGEGHAPTSWSPTAYIDFASRALKWIDAAPTADH